MTYRESPSAAISGFVRVIRLSLCVSESVGNPTSIFERHALGTLSCVALLPSPMGMVQPGRISGGRRADVECCTRDCEDGIEEGS